MLLSNNLSVIHLDETDINHCNSMEDTLEAEISRLETTINELVEANNDLPDVNMCASDLEEGEILDSFLCEEKQSENSRTFKTNLVIDIGDEGILDSEKKSQNVEHNIGDKHNITSDLEEGEILDSFLCEEKQSETSRTFRTNLVIDNGDSNHYKCTTCDVLDNVDEGKLDCDKKSQNVEYKSGDKHAVTSELKDEDDSNVIVNIVNHEKESKPNSIIYVTNSSELEIASHQICLKQNQKIGGRHETCIPVNQELNISSESESSSKKTVIISNNCEEMSLKTCDFELSTNDTNVHLNSIHTSNAASTCTTCDTSHKRNEANSHENGDCGVTRSSLLVSVDNAVREYSQESHLQLDTSESEDVLLYDDDHDVTCTFAEIKDNGSVVSSTPLKIKADTLRRWKPTFLSPNAESFLILDEFEEFIDQEKSVCSCINSPIQNKSVQMAGTIHSTEPKSHTYNNIFFKVTEDSSIADVKERGNNDTEQTKVAFCEAGDIKIGVQLGDEADEDGLQSLSLFADRSPVLANATSIQCHGVQDIFLPVSENRKIGTVHRETTDSEFLTDEVSLDTKRITRVVMHDEDSTDNMPEVNALASNLPFESRNQNSLEQKQNITSRNNDDYVSNNPQENYDNNNPEWELLRKLETDKERYRAVRQRWRNLTIPDPNQDLTCRNWRTRQKANKLTASASSPNSDAVIDERYASGSDVPASTQGHHKRSLSHEHASTTSQPLVKRPRTQSCTAVFDVKLEQLRRNIHYEKQLIYIQEQLALKQLSMKQIIERFHLRNHCRVHGIGSQMLQLYYQQQGDMERVQQEYDGARLAVDRANLSKVQILEKACEEVRAFHKFYQGLDHDSDADDAMFLSESQLEELWETEHLYDQYGKFYSVSGTNN